MIIILLHIFHYDAGAGAMLNRETRHAYGCQATGSRLSLPAALMTITASDADTLQSEYMT